MLFVKFVFWQSPILWQWIYLHCHKRNSTTLQVGSSYTGVNQIDPQRGISTFRKSGLAFQKFSKSFLNGAPTVCQIYKGTAAGPCFTRPSPSKPWQRVGHRTGSGGQPTDISIQGQLCWGRQVKPCQVRAGQAAPPPAPVCVG